MAKFRKRPAVVEAVQLRWDNWSEMCTFAGVGKLEDGKPQGVFLDNNNNMMPNNEWSQNIGLVIPTSEGLIIAIQNDWILRNDNGELEIWKPNKFYKTYEKI